jgi:murein L,D-transpeptidase YcbB/YkuD
MNPMRAPRFALPFRNAAVAGILLAGQTILAIATPLPADAAITAREAAQITVSISDMVQNEPNLPLPVRQRGAAIRAYYSAAGNGLLWLERPRMQAFIARLKAAEDDGLDPSAYPIAQLQRLAAVSANTDTRSKAVIELYFSASFLEYASDLQVGRFLPRKVDPGFYQQDKAIDQLAALTGLARQPDLDRFFRAWQPQIMDYEGLRETLAQYRAFQRAGGWPKVPMGDTLKPGMSDPRVPAIRARLAYTDGADANASPQGATYYDRALADAVASFQERHGLDADGIVGKATIVALNVPVEDRIEDIALAMERIRWMPANLGADRLVVNIAGFELKEYRQDKLKDVMAVVVGKPYSRTPVFSDTIKYVEINPYWNVPGSLAVKEELPQLKRNPAPLAAQGFEVVQGSKVWPVDAINWSQYGPGNFPFQLRQRPGPKNALGRLKIMFPNKFDVYLHDTPARTLFVKSDRAFSHGCIRLSRPIDAAVDVLSGTPGWDRARINATIATGERTVANLAKPLPVHITYFTAWVDHGVANFRSDIYEQDAKLAAALNGRTMAW